MGEWIEVSAKTTEEAVTEALIKLGTTSDHVEYEVLEKESKGFFGIGSRSAKIRARVKEEEKEPLVMTEPAREEEKEKEPVHREIKPEPAVLETGNDMVSKKEERLKEREARPAKSEGSEYRNPYKSSSFRPRRAEEEGSSFREQKEPARIENVEELKQDAKKFLTDVFHAMGMEAVLNVSFHEPETTIEINLEGEDMGILIGKRGQTLDSLQYLVSLVINRKSNSYVKVKLDTENYRERRKETLENLARNIAYKVKRTKRPVTLEPMNPYERRIIHSALQYDKFVETHSEGEEPYRKVVVTLKRNGRDYGSRRGNAYRRDYNHYRRTRQTEKDMEQKTSGE